MALPPYPTLQRHGQLAHFEALIEETLAANQTHWDGLNLSSGLKEELLVWVKQSALRHLEREIQDTKGGFTQEKFCEAIACYEDQTRLYITGIAFCIAKLQALKHPEARIFSFLKGKCKVLWEVAESYVEEGDPMDVTLLQEFYDNTVQLYRWVPNSLAKVGMVSYFIYLIAIIAIGLTLWDLLRWYVW